MGVKFINIAQAIGIGVLVAIDDSIAIRVLNQRVRVQRCHLNSVSEAILVCISQCGICFMHIDFLAVTQAVLVGVRRPGIGVVDIELFCVTQSVRIRVLVAINYAVTIRVLKHRIGV